VADFITPKNDDVLVEQATGSKLAQIENEAPQERNHEDSKRNSFAAGFPFKGRSYAKIEIGTLVSLPYIQRGFLGVPPDPYVLDSTRFKDICRFRVSNGDLIKAMHGELFHPINAGAYGSNSSRSYNEIPEPDIEALKPLAEIFARTASVPNDGEILLQRQRVATNNGASSETVREGPHRDGVKKLAIFCVNRSNVVGGVSLVFDADVNPEYAVLLEPGDILFIDDTKLWHDTTPIKGDDKSRIAYRDIIILTSPSCRAREYEKQIDDTGRSKKTLDNPLADPP
jgi:hypothetical protein